MAEHWTERLTAELRRVDHKAEKRAITSFLARKTRPNDDARFPLATLMRIMRGWADYPVRYSAVTGALESKGFTITGDAPQHVYGLEVLPPGEENEVSNPARPYTPDEWHAFCDALRALTTDDTRACDLPLSILNNHIRHWAENEGRECRVSPGTLRRMLRQAGYETYLRRYHNPAGKKRTPRYVRGLQLR
ncbi:hypothetical protein E6R61_05720 [Streptomyces sp. LRa12]|uniref:hypothetical protein n=1 Tax=Streptomyces sp. LRa12 TaxID=2563107 RepID=UPI00109E97AE|nr:hypothetical protein [Streptomyces sp. LRa12]THA98843.1 hypothetical protein E6R61_05720 [Streptomyces sp. LRa12]